MTVELTILMPCLNEARTIDSCIASARQFMEVSGVHAEILVADNGSTDGSVPLAEAAGARVVRVLTRGYGAALAAGIEAARGRYIIMGDADASYDFSSIAPFLASMRDGADLVIGNRFLGGIRPGAMPLLHRLLGNPVLSLLGRLFYRSSIRDFHCGLRGFKRERVRQLRLTSTGMEFASEMIVKAAIAGLRIDEVPTVLHPDGRGRPPHLRTWRDGWRHLRFLLIHAPAWLFLYPGLVLLATGVAGVLLLVWGPVRVGSVTLDIHTMLYAMVAAAAGFQMILFAVGAFLHAVQIQLLPRMPRWTSMFAAASLERLLLLGASLAMLGLLLAVGSLLLWSRASFRGVDPSMLMRVAIPAAGCMLMGFQLVTSAFMLQYLRMRPASPLDANESG